MFCLFWVPLHTMAVPVGLTAVHAIPLGYFGCLHWVGLSWLAATCLLTPAELCSKVCHIPSLCCTTSRPSGAVLLVAEYIRGLTEHVWHVHNCTCLASSGLHAHCPRCMLQTLLFVAARSIPEHGVKQQQQHVCIVFYYGQLLCT